MKRCLVGECGGGFNAASSEVFFSRKGRLLFFFACEAKYRATPTKIVVAVASRVDAHLVERGHHLFFFCG